MWRSTATPSYRGLGRGQRCSAYVFRSSDGGATYGQVAKLTAADAAASDRFGYYVAIDGNTIVVGAFQWITAARARSTFRTTNGGATYAQVAKLTASDAAQDDRFGHSVASTATPSWWGAILRRRTGFRGSANVFRTTDGGAAYRQVAKLTASDGASATILRQLRGDRRRAPSWSEPSAGIGGRCVQSSARFRRRRPRTSQVAKLTAADAAAGDLFGILRGDRRQHRRYRAHGDD